MPKIKIILGSTRPTRFAEQPGAWLMGLGKDSKDAEFELIDLAKISLPFLDEPEAAITGRYQNEHTKEWSRIINEADGFIFVVAEYNHGYTAALKNALDYLYSEWAYKPVAFLSYGSAAGGARAVDQLRPVVGHLNMYDISANVIFPSYYEGVKDGKFQFNERHEQAARVMLDGLVFWAHEMKPIREKLASRAG